MLRSRDPEKVHEGRRSYRGTPQWAADQTASGRRDATRELHSMSAMLSIVSLKL